VSKGGLTLSDGGARIARRVAALQQALRCVDIRHTHVCVQRQFLA